MKLGRFLLDAGLITNDRLQESLTIARDSKQPVGRVMVGLKFVKEQDLESALLAQSLVAQGSMNEVQAAQVLRQASQTNTRLEKLINDLDTERGQTISELGTLLVGAEYVSAQIYDQALANSESSGITPGRTLLLSQIISSKDLQNSLYAQLFLCENRITEAQALQGLKSCRQNRIDIADALEAMNLAVANNSEVLLADLLVSSNIVSAGDLLAWFERGVAENKKPSHKYVEGGLINESIADSGLRLQNFLARGVVSIEEARKILQVCNSEQKTLEQVATASNVFADSPIARRAVQLLLTSGCVAEETLDMATQQQAKYQMGASKSLLACGQITPNLLQAAIECAEYLDRGEINNNDASLALRESQRSKSPFSIALAALGAAPVIAPPVKTNTVESASEKPSRLKFLAEEVRGWFNYPNFGKLFSFVIVLVLGYIAVNTWIEIKYREIAYTILLAVFTGIFLFYAIFWNALAKREKVEQKERLDDADLTRQRLSKRKDQTRD